MRQPSNRSLRKPGCGAGTANVRIHRCCAEKSTALFDLGLPTCSSTPSFAAVDLRGRSRQTTPTRKQWHSSRLSEAHDWRPSQLRHSQPNHPLRSCDSICLASPLTDCRNSTVSAGALRTSARFFRARSRVAMSTASKFVSHRAADRTALAFLVVACEPC